MNTLADFFRDGISVTASNSDFQPEFNTITGDPSYVNMSSLSSEFSSIVEFCVISLGGIVHNVELDKRAIAVALEQANYEYSRISQTHYVESFFAQMVGGKRSYTLHDFQSYIPPQDYNIVTKLLGYYKENSRPYAGDRTPRKGFIDMLMLQEYYDLYSSGMDKDSNLSLENYVASVSGQSLEILQIYHGPLPVYNRYYDPYSINSLLNTEFNYSSYPTETVFYMLPVWMDLARMTTLSLGDMMRKSQLSYSLIGRKLQILPRPQQPFRVWFDYIVKDTRSDLDPLLDSTNPSLSGLTSVENNKQIINLTTVPLPDITWKDINSIGRQWIRRYTLAECMCILGWIRTRFSEVPITQTQLTTLNGPALLEKGEGMKERLEDWLRDHLDKMDLTDVIEKEARKAKAMTEILAAQGFPIFKY